MVVRSETNLIAKVLSGFIALTSMISAVAFAQSEVLIYNFRGGADGYGPSSQLVFDQAGNLYGVTYGQYGSTWGSVYKLSPNGDGTWTETQLHRFSGRADGSEPSGRLLIDRKGNLFGTTASDVFELSPRPNGKWKETVLYTFQGGNDAGDPVAGLIRDSLGNFFGTTTSGGTFNGGTVFELSQDDFGSWNESVLYSFPEPGAGPYGSLVMDKVGNLLGTTFRGGRADGGTVFELVPQVDGGWQEQTIHEFTSLFSLGDGSEPIPGLTVGPNGHFYGTTLLGGEDRCFTAPYGCGTVFEIAPTDDGTWEEQVIYSFHGVDGFLPYGQLAFDKAGNIYGTTEYGGNAGGCTYGFDVVNCGVAFKLTQARGVWSEQILVNFANGPLGGQPTTGLVPDVAGNLYGVSFSGGQFDAGLVYEISNLQ